MLHLSYFTTTTWSKTVLSLFSHLKTTNKVKKKPWNGILYICGMHAINTGSYSSKGDGLINVQNCTVCIKHSLKDLRQNNPGTLSPPSLHKWEMLSNSNLQTGDLCSQTTHTHSSEDSSTYTRTHACSKAYTPPHRVYAKLGLPLYFFFSSHVASTPRHKYTWYEQFSFCDGCYVRFTVIHHRSHIFIATVCGFPCSCVRACPCMSSYISVPFTLATADCVGMS